ncbi:MAG: choice-of-anchor tandem repeat GloVer-containing protein [Terriglobales bacterium]
MSKLGKLKLLHSFGAGSDGARPRAGVIQDAKGNLYGTTEGGGVHGVGTVFKLSPAGKETVLYSFTGGADGENPYAGVIQDAKGDLYGTSYDGGVSNGGTVFKLRKTGKITVLYSFTGSNGDGYSPNAGVIQDADGNLYGTTYYGGAFGVGTVFKLSKTGKETVLHSFTCGADGCNPPAGVIQDAKGHLYGTAEYGGDSSCGGENSGCGVVFELTP